jgi:glutathione peroxidase
MQELYSITAKDINGNDFLFESLRGKVVLIVNTASKCGFTPQFEGLQKLHEKYAEKGLMILGFPSNDFLFQDPGTNEEIKNFCLLNYGVDFLMFEKIHVKGSKIHPLYKYLVGGAGNKSFKGSIKWNFTKFLFDREGNIVDRFASAKTPEEIEKNIVELL